MTRMEILIRLSQLLKGRARKVRVDIMYIEPAMILYIREYIRHCMRGYTSDFGNALRQWWNDEAMDHGNQILKAMDKDNKEGGVELKAKIADLVMTKKIIEKSLLNQYKLYFKGSKLTKSVWIRYNHFILLRAVGEGFLYSLNPSHTTQTYSKDMTLSTEEPRDNGMEEIGFPQSCWIFAENNLEEVGMRNGLQGWQNRKEVEFLHYSNIQGTSYPVNNPRTGLYYYVSLFKDFGMFREDPWIRLFE